jgi:hypothetical protein
MIISFKRSQQKNGKVKAYAKVQSHVGGAVYSVVYIRTNGRQKFRGWICDCESFLFQKFARNQHCKHIDEVTETYGRYGVPKATLKVGGKVQVLQCDDAKALIGRKGEVISIANSILVYFPGWVDGHSAGGDKYGMSAWFLAPANVKAIN